MHIIVNNQDAKYIRPHGQVQEHTWKYEGKQIYIHGGFQDLHSRQTTAELH